MQTAARLGQRFRVKGVNDDTDNCECCGRKGLNRVVWLAPLDLDGNEEAEPLSFGVVCAAKLMRTTHTRIQRTAEEADRKRELDELATVHQIGAERSVVNWVIESIGQNGGSITLLDYANGLLPAVRAWAENRWPHRAIEIRRPRIGNHSY